MLNGEFEAAETNSSPYAAISSMDRLSIEPEKIKRWREDQKQLLEEKGNVLPIRLAQQFGFNVV